MRVKKGKRKKKGNEECCEELHHDGDNLTLALRIHRIVCFFQPIDALCCVFRLVHFHFLCGLNDFHWKLFFLFFSYYYVHYICCFLTFKKLLLWCTYLFFFLGNGDVVIRVLFVAEVKIRIFFFLGFGYNVIIIVFLFIYFKYCNIDRFPSFFFFSFYFFCLFLAVH